MICLRKLKMFSDIMEFHHRLLVVMVFHLLNSASGEYGPKLKGTVQAKKDQVFKKLFLASSAVSKCSGCCGILQL